MRSPRTSAPRTQPRMIGNFDSCLDPDDDAVALPVSAVAPTTEEVAKCAGLRVEGSAVVDRDKPEDLDAAGELTVGASSVSDGFVDVELGVVEASMVEDVAAASEAAETTEDRIEVTSV